MPEQIAPVNGLDICYETFGKTGDRPVLLIMGLAGQMIRWEDEFCARLAERECYVVRFDNRDVGRSARLSGRISLVQAAVLGKAPYHLTDMADDAAGLLDHLGLESAHVVGVSLGGMIAQTLAIHHPSRVRSLVSIMSTTGSKRVGLPSPAAARDLTKPVGRSREDYIDAVVSTYRLISSPAHPFDEERARGLAGRSYDRGFNPGGVARQLAASLAAPDRTKALRAVTVPALVIHGDKDALINVSGGKATAKALPNAELDIVEGMGHDLPPGLWDRFIDGIIRTADRGEAARTTAD